MKKKTDLTIYDISKIADVSPATVSRVMNDSANVSDKKRNAVLRAISENSFKPNALAQSLTNKVSKTIGFIVPDIKNPYFSTLFYEFELIASAQGYSVLLCNSLSDFSLEERLLDMLEQKQVDDIVFMGGRIDANPIEKHYIERLYSLAEKKPFIAAGEMNDDILVQVFNNADAILYRLMEHFQDIGCKSLAVLGGRNDVLHIRQKREMLSQLSDRYGMEIRPEWFIDSSFSIEGGRAAMLELLSLTQRPDAVFCINDIVAVGAMETALRSGIEIPGKMFLSGFDGVDISGNMFPSITTCQTNYEKFAQMIFDLLEKINGGEIVPVKNMLDMMLIKRESTARKMYCTE